MPNREVGRRGVGLKRLVRTASLAAIIMCVGLLPVGGARMVSAQTPVPTERMKFREAVDRAMRSNPSSAVAAAGILRAEGLLGQARAATLLQITGNITTTTLNTGVEFQG